jgi:ParB-like chromosome segregation protein Spo0J
VKLQISLIRRDFQDPELLFDEKVHQIAEAMRRGEIIPPVTVRHDGENYWLQDGFHRVAAAVSIGRDAIKVESLPGARADIQAEFDRMAKEKRGTW